MVRSSASTRPWARLASVVAAAVLVFSMLPVSALADDTSEESTVTVTIENTKATVEGDGAPWEGVLVDSVEVTIDEGDTILDALCVAAEMENVEIGLSGDYVYSVNGLESGVLGGWDGWMVLVNDWLINSSPQDLLAEDGDVIELVYSADGGLDYGGDWDNNYKTISSIVPSVGTLTPEFSSDTHDYTLSLPSGTESVDLDYTATNKNFQVKVTADEMEYKNGRDIPVYDEMVITIECGNPEWPTMNSASDVSSEVYTITVSIDDSSDGTTDDPDDGTTDDSSDGTTDDPDDGTTDDPDDGITDDPDDGTTDDPVTRLSGDDRYATALEAIKATYTEADANGVVILANGGNYPDALAASGLAGVTDGYIVLVNGQDDTLNEYSAEALEMLEPSVIYVAGGVNSISDEIVEEATQYMLDGSTADDVIRLSGDVREDTAIDIRTNEAVADLDDWSDETAIIVSGYNYADALSASSYAYAEQAPVFLTSSDGTLSEDALDAIVNGEYTRILIVGGNNSVSVDVYDADNDSNPGQLEEAGIDRDSITRVSGDDRYGTSDVMALYATQEANYSDEKADRVLNDSEPSVASGQNFPDALIGGVFAGKTGSPLVLAYDSDSGMFSIDLGGFIYDAIVGTSDTSGSATNVWIIGGPNSISDTVMQAISDLFESDIDESITDENEETVVDENEESSSDE